MAENNTVDGNLEKLLDSLISVIGDEAGLFEEFLKLLERQQKALIENDAGELKVVTNRLQRVVSQSQVLERDRIDIVDRIRALAGSDDDLNVSQICEMADSARSSRLRSFREAILGLYERIEQTRMRNSLLIEQSMEQIRNTIDMIGRIPAQNGAYHKHGGYSRGESRLGLDRRV